MSTIIIIIKKQLEIFISRKPVNEISIYYAWIFKHFDKFQAEKVHTKVELHKFLE